MSIERAVKCCKSCFAYTSSIKHAYATPGSYYQLPNDSCNKIVGFNILNFIVKSSENGSQTLESRDKAMQSAMLALEESLNKNTREATALESNTTTNSPKLVRDALLACMNCDYSKPSIVDIFIMKSQDSENK